MNTSGLLRVIDFSDGSVSVYADVVAAPSELRSRLTDELRNEVDLDAHEPGDVIGEVVFTDVFGESDYRYTLNERAVL